MVLNIKARPTKGELIEVHLSKKLWETASVRNGRA
jgi:hypothetical protein